MASVSKIGFVGIGMMGRPMAKRLSAAGHALHVSDVDVLRAAEFAGELGAKVLDGDAATDLDVLITMLPNSSIVEAVLLGDGGWAGKLKPGATVIDMSSSEPARSRALGEALEAMGLVYLDAPVSGGVGRAEKGSLAILVGGPSDGLAANAALLGAMGTSIIHVGPAGSGHAAKALNNFVSAAGLAATVEALVVAERFGIDPAVMTDVLNASSGRSNTSENKVKQFMLSGTFGSGFALKLMDKDLKIAAALASSLGVPMTIGAANAQMWDAAAKVSTPATDHTEMYRLIPELQKK